MNAQIKERMDAAVAEAAAKKYPPRIRPNYIGGEFVGFRIETFNAHSIRYQAIGVNFTTYKAAFLSLRAIQSGNLPLEGCVTPRTDHPSLFPPATLPSFRDINWFRVFVTIGCVFCIVAMFSGCTHVRPLAEYQHISHASDGIGGTGFDTLSMGVRWRPMDGVTVDVLEGYSPNKLNDRHEIFTGRVQVEF